MDEFTRAFVHGQAGREKVEDAMRGDLSGAYVASWVEQATAPDDEPRRGPFERRRSDSWPDRPVRSGARAIAIFVVAVVVLILIFAH